MFRIPLVIVSLLCLWSTAYSGWPSSGQKYPKSVSGIGVPTNLGNTTANPTSATIIITTTAPIVSGNLVVVCASGVTSSAISSVTDGTNTYTKAVGAISLNLGTECWYKGNATAVASSASITITWSGTASNRSANAFQVTGITTIPLDQQATSTTATNSPSVATGVLSQNSEIIIGVLGTNTNNTITESSGFTTIFNTVVTGDVFHDAYQIVNSTASVNYAPTISGVVQRVVTGVATFKGS